MPSNVLLALGMLGILGGLGLLWTGLRAQRAGARVEGIGTSPIGLLTAGEVRITGEAIPAGVTLTSRLRLRPSVYYRAVVDEQVRNGRHELLDEALGVGFFVKDATGEIRVFPRAATWEVPLDGRTTSAAGGEWGRGAASLLLGPDPGVDPLHPGRSDAPDFAMPMLVTSTRNSLESTGEVGYREARIEPGDIVTVVGRAIPFRDLADPTEADHADVLATVTGNVDGNHIPDPAALRDPVVAGNYREALEAGILVDPTRAWGNAAIEGFGIGQPVRPPELDPGITSSASAGTADGVEPDAGALKPDVHAPDPAIGVAGLALAAASPALAAVTLPAALAQPSGDAGFGMAGHAPAWAGPSAPSASAATASPPSASAVAAAIQRAFEIPPDRLVIAAGPAVPLLIAAGTPAQVVARNEQRFLVGLLGAALAIGGAILVSVALSGLLGPVQGG